MDMDCIYKALKQNSHIYGSEQRKQLILSLIDNQWCHVIVQPIILIPFVCFFLATSIPQSPTPALPLIGPNHSIFL